MCPSPELNDGRWRGLPQPGSAAFESCLGTLRASLVQLSPRQSAVAFGVWAGLTEKEIGGWLQLSSGTVHDHLIEALRRLRSEGVLRRTDLALAGWHSQEDVDIFCLD